MKTKIKLLGVLMLLITTAFKASAYDFEVNGIYYNKISDTEVEVTYRDTNYNSYSGSGSVTIPASVTYNGTAYSVTSIGNYAFDRCIGLTSVTIPNSVTEIGGYAFDRCIDLTSVNIPNSVTEIGGYAFSWCTNLTSVYITDLAAWCKIDFGNHDANPLYNAHSLYLNGEKVTDLVIPNSVTSIGNYAFDGCSGLTSVTIHNSVTNIGNYSFRYCSRLTSVTIPNSVTNIGEGAFYNCSGLTSVTIPNSVTNIGDYAFYGCSGLTSATIPNSVTEIGGQAFRDCSGLTSVTIPNSVTNIGEGAFYNCSGLTSVTIGNSVKTIGYYAFYYCSGLTSVTIPNSVTDIGGCAFLWCMNLTSVTIPNSVKTIGNGAFAFCSGLTSVTIPNTVTSIGNEAFEGCSGLTSVNIPNSVTSIGDEAFDDCSGLKSVHITDLAAWCKIVFNNSSANPLNYAHTLYLNGKEVTNLVIPNSVTTIGNYAFDGCSGLTSVTIPNSVTSIGDWAFYGCSSLTSVAIPNSVTSIGSWAFSDCSGLTSVTIPKSVTEIGNYAFDKCSGLIKSAYPNHLSNPFSNGIGVSYDANNSLFEDGFIYNADKTTLYFAQIDLSTVTIPNSVTSIGNYAFYGCSRLKSVTIGASVTSIGNNAFSYNNNNNRDERISIPKVIWLGNTPPSGADKVSAKVNYVSNDQFTISNRKVYPFLSSKFEVDGVVYVPVSPSERTCDVIDCNYVQATTDIVIDSIVSNKNVQLKVLKVNPYAFYGNDSITSLKIQNSGNIGNQAFYDCTKLGTVTFGPKVTSIGGSAFYNCNALKSLTLPDNISSIGESSFENCSSLSNVSIGKGISSLPNRVFSGCSSLTSLTIPTNINSIGDYTFSGCTKLADVTFEDVNKDSSQISISLGSNGSSPLFADCPLDEVYIGRKLSYKTSSSYGYSPFYRNTSLRSVKISDIETQIYNNEFYGCSNLQEFSCGDGVTTIGRWAFSGCSAMTSFASGSKVESIGQEAFSDCTGLTSFTSLAAVPPTCGNQALDDINKWECVLHVPAESIDDYQAAEQWKEFFFMEETQGVDDVITDAAAGEVVGYYNLQGVRADEPWEGLNIVVYSDGTRRKIRY